VLSSEYPSHYSQETVSSTQLHALPFERGAPGAIALCLSRTKQCPGVNLEGASYPRRRGTCTRASDAQDLTTRQLTEEQRKEKFKSLNRVAEEGVWVICFTFHAHFRVWLAGGGEQRPSNSPGHQFSCLFPSLLFPTIRVRRTTTTTDYLPHSLL
jgi:hypothetical protein